MIKQKINVFPHVYVASISTWSRLYGFQCVAAKLCAADANESYINSAFNCFALLIYAKSGNKFSVPKSPWCRFQRRSLAACSAEERSSDVDGVSGGVLLADRSEGIVLPSTVIALAFSGRRRLLRAELT